MGSRSPPIQFRVSSRSSRDPVEQWWGLDDESMGQGDHLPQARHLPWFSRLPQFGYRRRPRAGAEYSFEWV
jgi:hypothetical protein